MPKPDPKDDKKTEKKVESKPVSAYDKTLADLQEQLKDLKVKHETL